MTDQEKIEFMKKKLEQIKKNINNNKKVKNLKEFERIYETTNSILKKLK